MLCLDSEAERRIATLGRGNLRIVRLDELETAEPRLREAKKDRSVIEYYFTCGPALLEWALTQLPHDECLSYVDADLYFFSSPRPLEHEMRAHSIGVVEHRFSRRNASLLAVGRFNVGWLCFRHDARGLACLRWWKERCLEWCADRVEPDRYADQKYLDRWPELFDGVRIIRHPGANVAPWNADHLGIRTERDRLLVENEPLIFYHFQGIKQHGPWLFDLNVDRFGARCRGALRRGVYLPYLRTVLKFSEGARLTGIREPAAALGVRTLKKALWNGGYALKVAGSLW